MTWVPVVLLLALAAHLSYAFWTERRRERPPKSTQTRDGIAVGLASFFFVSLFSTLPEPTGDWLRMALFAAIALLVSWKMAGWPRRRRRAGELLLDLGRRSTSTGPAVGGVLFLGMAVVFAVQLAQRETTPPVWVLVDLVSMFLIAAFLIWVGPPGDKSAKPASSTSSPFSAGRGSNPMPGIRAPRPEAAYQHRS